MNQQNKSAEPNSDAQTASNDIISNVENHVKKKVEHSSLPIEGHEALVVAAKNIEAALISNAAPIDVIHALTETLKEKGEESVTISPLLLIPLLEALADAERK